MSQPAYLFPQVGSKSRMADRLIPLIADVQFTTYVEPFVGTGSIYFRLQAKGAIPQGCSVFLNDLDKEITNLFQVVRTNHHELCRAVSLTPYAAAEVGQVDGAQDPVERARRFLAHAHMTYIGAEKLRRFSIAKSPSKSRVNRWNRMADDIQALLEPLRRATITNLDAIKCVEKLASDDTVFVVDPPYIGREDFYRAWFDRHQELADLLNHVPAASVIVTHVAHADLERLYPSSRWHRQVVQQPIRMTNRWTAKQRVNEEIILIRRADMLVQKGDKRRCDVCSDVFVVARADARYCSNACRQRGHRHRAKQVGVQA